jgi:hypothetical protein
VTKVTHAAACFLNERYVKKHRDAVELSMPNIIAANALTRGENQNVGKAPVPKI